MRLNDSLDGRRQQRCAAAVLCNQGILLTLHMINAMHPHINWWPPVLSTDPRAPMAAFASSMHRHAAAAARPSAACISAPRAAHRGALRVSSSTSPAVAVTAPPAAAVVAKGSQLEQLAAMTVLSIDTGDLSTIQKWASTGLITDATTNPLFGEHVLGHNSVGVAACKGAWRCVGVSVTLTQHFEPKLRIAWLVRR